MSERSLWSQSFESLGQDHLTDPYHTSPSSVTFNAVNSATVSQPDDIIEICQKAFFIFTVVLVDSTKKGDWGLFVKDDFLSFGENIKCGMS